jgi:hypothetical protein
MWHSVDSFLSILLFIGGFMKLTMSNRLKAIIGSAALIAAFLSPAAPAAQAALTLPSGPWPACSESRVTYCIESVSILAIGGAGEEQLRWIPSGTASNEVFIPVDPTTLPPVDPALDPALDPGAIAGPISTTAGAATFGRWTTDTWASNGYNSFGYEGINISISKANAFTNHLFFTAQPVKVDGANLTKAAMNSSNSKFLADLNPDIRISFKVRTGAAVTGVVVGFAFNTSTSAAAGVLTFRGYPVITPKVNDARKCSGEQGQSDAEVVGMQGFVVVENDDMGFGIDGLSGRMVVASNGQCATSTPVWDDVSQSMSWTVGAPHFNSKGTANKGFYKAIIPANDALLLWGLTDPKRAASALTIQVIEEDGGPSVSAKKVSFKNGNIIIDVTGFSFSKPKVVIKKNTKASAKKFFTTQKTFKCYDSKTKKTTTYKKVYGCPAGTKKR